MARNCTDAALSRKQRVFVVLEDEPGVLKFPAPTDAIRPAGDATLNQTPTYSDSKEKFDTLDLLDKFPNATPPGEWTIPQYLRLAGFGAAPQGQALFEATMGRKGVTALAILADDISDADMDIEVEDLAGDITPVGVIQIGSELIRYGRFDAELNLFSDCIRGYNDTAPAAHATADSVVFKSVSYHFDTCSPTVSIWIETDHLIQYLAGAVVDSLRIPIQNEDGVLVTFSGKGMRMGWAGRTEIRTTATAGDTKIFVQDAIRYSVGARIQNYTQADAGTNGYEIEAINTTSGEITLTTPIADNWDAGDEITGYLPTAAVSGIAAESRDTAVILGGVPGKVKNTELNIGVPKEFKQDEVGTKFPEEYFGSVRNITMNLDCVLRKAAVDKFHEGYNGKETTIALTMGRIPGQKATFFMPRAKVSVPTVQFDGPAVGLQIPATALGVDTGENSLTLIFE
jgi:hypothetical protein